MATSAHLSSRSNKNASSNASSTRESNIMDNSDTMAQLNLMISKFESLSQPQNLGNQENMKGLKNDNNRNRLIA